MLKFTDLVLIENIPLNELTVMLKRICKTFVNFVKKKTSFKSYYDVDVEICH